MFAESHLGKLRAIVGPRLLLIPSVRVVFQDESGRLLLQRRSDFGNWGFPGGSPEEGESMTECIERETEEETGLVVTAFQPFGFASDPATETITFPNGDQTQTFSLLVHATRWRGTLRAGTEETTRLEYFDPRRLPEMSPNHRRTAERFVEYRRTGAFQMY